jgi:hypothetical protein
MIDGTVAASNGTTECRDVHPDRVKVWEQRRAKTPGRPRRIKTPPERVRARIRIKRQGVLDGERRTNSRRLSLPQEPAGPTTAQCGRAPGMYEEAHGPIPDG